jgi:predicted transcriptional regulator YheO
VDAARVLGASNRRIMFHHVLPNAVPIITDLRLLASSIEELTGSPAVTPEPIAFTDDIGQVIRAVIDEEEVALGHAIDRMTKQDRLAIFRALERRGIFALQRSVPSVAEYLGISRATAYNYLHTVRSGASLPDDDADGLPAAMEMP